MEKELTELIDKKIKELREIEDILIEIAGSYDNAKFILEKIYRVINVQKRIDNVYSKTYEVI